MRRFENSLHVNLRELEGILQVPRKASSFSLMPHRLANGTDSLVGIGAFTKGKSQSFKINSRLRVSIPDLVLGQKQVVNFKVATKQIQAMTLLGTSRSESLRGRQNG